MDFAKLCAVTAVAGTLCAQSDTRLTFDVASVKPHPIREGFVRRGYSPNLQCPPFHCGMSGNRFTEEMASLTDLMMDAFSIRRYQVQGLPDWGDTGHDVYDIAATVDSGTPTQNQVREMLRNLLADRFQLKVHRETKELPYYALVMGKSGAKLAQVPQPEGKPPVLTCAGGGDFNAPTAEAAAFHRSWARMAEILSMNADRPVIDQTEFEGMFCTRDGQDPAMAVMSDLGMSMRGRGGRGGPDDPSNLFTAVEQRLGLKLEARKGPVEIVVIDHVARPSGN